MSFNFLDQGYMPEDSYSRQLDRRVGEQEYPYGYDTSEPPAGHPNATSDAHSYRDKRLMPQRSLDVREPPLGQDSFPDRESKMRIKMKGR